MRLFSILAAIFAIAGTAAVSLGGILGEAVNPANGHKYYLLSQNTWTASEAEAVTMGTHLATINDSQEHEWVYSTFSTFGGTDRALWIGLNDAAQEGTFVWSSGEPVTYTNWGLNEPNDVNGQDDYAYITAPAHQVAGRWNDLGNVPSSNFGPLHGVVEVVPEPSSLSFAGIFAAALLLRRRARLCCKPVKAGG